MELAKPILLILDIVTLYRVFTTAFLIPASDVQQRVYDSLSLLALAGALSLIGGLVFGATEGRSNGAVDLTSTLPVKLFCWATVLMFVLFTLSWYLESHCIFYRDVRF